VNRPAVTSGLLTRNLEGAWTDYVLAHPEGSLFHTLEWRDVIRSVFGHEERYIVALRNGRIAGILPLFFVKSWIFGKSVLSVPFGVYGGVVADGPEEVRALVAGAGDFARETGAEYVELRHRKTIAPDLPETTLYQAFVAEVPKTREGCLLRIPRKARAEVRHAIKAGLVADFKARDLKELYQLFAINKRGHGSPIFPESLFQKLHRILGEKCLLLRVTKDGRTLSAVLSFVFKDTMMPYYSGSVPDAAQHSADNFMYHALMEKASDLGLSHFDFGRSREGTGPYEFKRHQGFVPEPLHYQYVLNTAKELPSLNPSNPRYDFAKAVFRKMPLFVAQKLGSFISKRMPH
jgi:FemAB-related protein (PEP-CTERM system-associated)